MQKKICRKSFQFTFSLQNTFRPNSLEHDLAALWLFDRNHLLLYYDLDVSILFFQTPLPMSANNVIPSLRRWKSNGLFFGQSIFRGLTFCNVSVWLFEYLNILYIHVLTTKTHTHTLSIHSVCNKNNICQAISIYMIV